MDKARLEAIVDAVVREFDALPRGNALAAASAAASPWGRPAPAARPLEEKAALTAAVAAGMPLARLSASGVVDPADPEGLAAIMETTRARIGVGRAGPRPRTGELLRFQADLAVTKDALAGKVDPGLLSEFGLFTAGTMVSGGREEYLLRPDLGRRLSPEARTTIAGRCAKKPAIQLCVGDGLSARAIEANLRKIFPVIRAGCATEGLSFGTPFFIENCRVGVMNDIGDLLEPEVLVLLVGERPGLGRADSMSAYMGYRPRAGLSDADRDVVCNIYDGGGVNPLEAGAYVLRLARRMMAAGASGVKLRLLEEKI
jgi:ethanolamine ammonia-lyase small subunit